MDFGEILEQWDAQQKEQKIKKKTHAAGAEKMSEKQKSYELQMKADSERKINPMELWLRRYGVMDKDAAADEYEYRTKIESREYLRTLKPEDVVDLHGLTREQAWQKLDAFVSACKIRGLRKILIIHGKGNHSHGTDPVLGEMVRSFIEADRRLGSSGHPDRNHGGTGATWVIIRR